MAVFPIYVANFLLLICYTIALWFISGANRKLEGMRLLAWAYTAALAAALIAIAGARNDHWFLHALAPTLLLLGLILIHYSFLSFVGRPPRRPWGWLSLLTFGFCAFLYCSYHAELSMARGILNAGLLGFQASLSGYVLLRYAEKNLRYPARCIALVFLAFSFRSAVRIFWMVHYHNVPENMQGWWAQLSAISTYLILNAFTPLGYLWLATTRLQDDLQALSSTDSLTGVLNRRAFEERGLQEVERAHRYNLPLSVLAMDVDHFKSFNDTRGHAGGDLVLIAMADAIRELLRGSDYLARIGGDEFMILLTGTDREGAFELAERLRERIDHMPVEFQDGSHMDVHASFGTATLPPQRVGGNIDTWDMLLQRADAALYRAKQAGRNRVEMAEDLVAMQ